MYYYIYYIIIIYYIYYYDIIIILYYIYIIIYVDWKMLRIPTPYAFSRILMRGERQWRGTSLTVHPALGSPAPMVASALSSSRVPAAGGRGRVGLL